jgi:hypothetical protein
MLRPNGAGAVDLVKKTFSGTEPPKGDPTSVESAIIGAWSTHDNLGDYIVRNVLNQTCFK